MLFKEHSSYTQPSSPPGRKKLMIPSLKFVLIAAQHQKAAPTSSSSSWSFVAKVLDHSAANISGINHRSTILFSTHINCPVLPCPLIMMCVFCWLCVVVGRRFHSFIEIGSLLTPRPYELLIDRGAALL